METFLTCFASLCFVFHLFIYSPLFSFLFIHLNNSSTRIIFHPVSLHLFRFPFIHHPHVCPRREVPTCARGARPTKGLRRRQGYIPILFCFVFYSFIGLYNFLILILLFEPIVSIQIVDWTSGRSPDDDNKIMVVSIAVGIGCLLLLLVVIAIVIARMNR